MTETIGLTEYIISYSKAGFEVPITDQGLALFRQEVEKMKAQAIVGTDYLERVKNVSSLCALSFISRPNTETLSIHRVWTDSVAADAFFKTNDLTIFETFRQNGWSVSYTSRPFDTNALNGSDITLI